MELKSNIQAIVSPYLRDIFAEAVAQVETSCLELIESSGFSRQSDYLEVIQLLNEKRADVLLVCEQQLFDTVSAYPSSTSSSQHTHNTDGVELSLVNDQHLESDLAISNWVKKLDGKLDDVIWPVLGRLIQLGRGDLQDYHRSDILLPLSPSSFGAAIAVAASGFTIDFRFELVFFKAFGRAFEAGAQAFYQELNQLLDADNVQIPARPSQYDKASVHKPEDIAESLQDEVQESAGVEVEIADQQWAAPASLTSSQQGEQAALQQVFQHMQHQHRAEALSEQAAPACAADIRAEVIEELGGEAAWQNSPAMAQVMNSLVNEKVHNRQQLAASQAAVAERQARATSMTGQGMTTASGVSYGDVKRVAQPSASTFMADDYCTALAKTQSQAIAPVKIAERNDNLVAENESQFIEALQHMAESGERCDITADDADLVDLVGLLFKFVLDDNAVPDKAKTLLSYMHTPYLKLALMDKTFFEDAEHPARVLLNTLAKAAATWQLDWRIYPRIQEAVHSVLTDYESDIVIFEKVLKSFEQFELALVKRANVAQERSQQQMQSEELRKIARTEAWIDINELLEGKRVPKVFYNFYKELWLEVLSLQYISCAGESAEYKQLRGMAERLINSVQTKYSQAKMSTDKALRFEQMRSELMRDLADTLKLTGISLVEAQQHFKLMRQVQQLAFEGYPLQLVAPEVVEETSVVAAPRFTQQQEEMREYLSALAFGSLFDFQDGDLQQRLKLAWHNPKSQRFMFVNHSGVKTRVESMDELMSGMLSGRVKEVVEEKRSFFERALESIIETFSFRAPEPVMAMAI